MSNVERHAVRGIVLDPEHRILLMQSNNPDHGGTFWLTPGGGCEPGEPPWTCLARELREETGLREFEAGPQVWTRRHTFVWKDRTIVQREDFYIVRVQAFVPTMYGNPEPLERASFLGFRWWTAEEIVAAPDRFAPRRLGFFLGLLLSEGPPPQVIDVGI